MRGKPLGFGIDTQVLEAAAGLNSARERIRSWVGEAMLVARENLVVTHRRERESEFVDEDGGAFLFLVGADKIGRDRVCAQTILNQSSTADAFHSSSSHSFIFGVREGHSLPAGETAVLFNHTVVLILASNTTRESSHQSSSGFGPDFEPSPQLFEQFQYGLLLAFICPSA
jgi:hypothetical protein